MSTEPDQDAIAAVLGRIPSGVFILTAGNEEGNETGMLASWVQQASFTPPMISVAVNSKRYLNKWLEQKPYAVLNYVGETQFEFLKHFGKGFEPEENAFDEVSVIRGETGLPVLREALGYLEGRICSQVESGDHQLYLLEITSAGAGDLLEKEKPMVHIRKNGFGY